jgi:hypothetical protein
MAKDQTKAKLTAAGCPPDVADHVAAKLPAGVSAAHVQQLAALPGFNWSALPGLLVLLQQNGPQIIQAIIALFGAAAAPAPPAAGGDEEP